MMLLTSSSLRVDTVAFVAYYHVKFFSCNDDAPIANSLTCGSFLTEIYLDLVSRFAIMLS